MAENTNTTNKPKRGRKPKTETETKKVDVNKDLEKENSELLKMIAQMKNQMDAMQEQIDNQKNNDGGKVVIQQNDTLTRTVKVYSMLPYTYNLTTRPMGKGGKVYTFKGFGESKSIRFTDMQDILTLKLNQFEEGYAILDSKKDYEDLGIGYIYDEVMSKDKMEKLISLESQECVDIILGMSEDQQRRIADIVARKITNGFSYDYNRIKELEDEGIEINSVVEMLKATDSE